MTGKTHIAVGIAAALALGITSPAALAAAGVGALAPDIDHPGSKISRRLTPGRLPRSTIGRFLAGLGLVVAGGLVWMPLLVPGFILIILAGIPHRGFIHSPALAMALAAAAFHLAGMDGGLVVAFTVGYLSHLLADSLTDHGIPMLWPVSNNHYGVGLMRTGGILEGVVLAGCIGFIGWWGIGLAGVELDIKRLLAIIDLLN